MLDKKDIYSIILALCALLLLVLTVSLLEDVKTKVYNPIEVAIQQAGGPNDK